MHLRPCFFVQIVLLTSYYLLTYLPTSQWFRRESVLLLIPLLLVDILNRKNVLRNIRIFPLQVDDLETSMHLWTIFSASNLFSCSKFLAYKHAWMKRAPPSYQFTSAPWLLIFLPTFITALFLYLEAKGFPLQLNT